MSITIHDLKDLDENTLSMISFSLIGKTNGRIVRHSMAIQNQRGHEVSEDEVSIDHFNNLEAAAEELLANKEFLNNAGVTQVDHQQELARWLGVLEVMASRTADGPSLVETFKGVINNVHNKFTMTDEQAKTAAQASGQSEDTLKAMFNRRRSEQVAQSAEAVTRALHVVENTEAEIETPEGFEEVYLASIQSGKKAALKTASSVEDFIASATMLKAVEDLA